MGTPNIHNRIPRPIITSSFLVRRRHESNGGLLDNYEVKCLPRSKVPCRPRKHEDAFGDAEVYLNVS